MCFGNYPRQNERASEDAYRFCRLRVVFVQNVTNLVILPSPPNIGLLYKFNFFGDFDESFLKFFVINLKRVFRTDFRVALIPLYAVGPNKSATGPRNYKKINAHLQ